MENTFISCLMHVVFGTMGQRSYLLPDIRSQLVSYLSAIAKSRGTRLITLGGTENHVHLLLAIPARLSIESAVLPLKEASQTWLRQHFDNCKGFTWQKGFAAYSISRSQLESTMRFIQNHQQHHLHKSFREEYIEFLRYHHIPFREEKLFGD